VRLNLDGWEEADDFTLLQIVLAAKFDSGRSREMMGVPLVHNLLQQLGAYDFQTPCLARSDWHAPAHPAIVERIAAALDGDDIDWPDDLLDAFIRQMAYPFTLEDTAASHLRGRARST
jgi:hypothetical protein